jgi:hypothetical protein
MAAHMFVRLLAAPLKNKAKRDEGRRAIDMALLPELVRCLGRFDPLTFSGTRSLLGIENVAPFLDLFEPSLPGANQERIVGL